MCVLLCHTRPCPWEHPGVRASSLRPLRSQVFLLPRSPGLATSPPRALSCGGELPGPDALPLTWGRPGPERRAPCEQDSWEPLVTPPHRCAACRPSSPWCGTPSPQPSIRSLVFKLCIRWKRECGFVSEEADMRGVPETLLSHPDRKWLSEEEGTRPPAARAGGSALGVCPSVSP